MHTVRCRIGGARRDRPATGMWESVESMSGKIVLRLPRVDLEKEHHHLPLSTPSLAGRKS